MCSWAVLLASSSSREQAQQQEPARAGPLPCHWPRGSTPAGAATDAGPAACDALPAPSPAAPRAARRRLPKECQSPTEWFIADDPAQHIRYFVIQARACSRGYPAAAAGAGCGGCLGAAWLRRPGGAALLVVAQQALFLFRLPPGADRAAALAAPLHVRLQGSDNLDHWRVNLTFDPVPFEDPALGVKVRWGMGCCSAEAGFGLC